MIRALIGGFVKSIEMGLEGSMGAEDDKDANIKKKNSAPTAGQCRGTDGKIRTTGYNLARALLLQSLSGRTCLNRKRLSST